MSETACIIPWTNFVVTPDGQARFCCEVPPGLTVNGRTGSIYHDSIDDLWNGDEIVEVRQAMARGERPASCQACWKREAAGGVSRRQLINEAYTQIGGELKVEELTQLGAADSYRLTRRPDWFVLQMGNICTLRCRSCDPLYSTRIAADPVQSAWSEDLARELGGEVRRDRQLARAKGTSWWEDVDATADMIASGAQGNAVLSLMGGEPFVIKHTWLLLEALVERGVAQNMLVGLATNGQQQHPKLAELAPKFRSFNLTLSIDGHGTLYEYLRYGASWEKLDANIRAFQQTPNVDVSAVPTLQNCNALDMVTLLRFMDGHGLRLAYNVVATPARLSPTNLPVSVRREVIQRLRAYQQEGCRPENLNVVAAYIEALEEVGDAFNPELFTEFMAFTNDLDASRGQQLSDVAPELVELIRAAGVTWSDDRRYTLPMVRA